MNDQENNQVRLDIEVLEELYPVSQPTNLLEKLRTLLLTNKITISDDPEAISDDFDDLIEILAAEDDEVLEIEIGQEAATRLIVEAQINIATAQAFFERVRSSIEPLMAEEGYPEQRIRDEDTFWFHQTEMLALADRWNIPVLLFAEKRIHWLLALHEPVHENTGWRVIVYDPQVGGERWLDLPNWDGSFSFENLTANSASQNTTLRTLKESGETYSLSLFGDQELAARADILDAKRARIQFDGKNCGPACLFMAALRNGIKKDGEIEFNGFKFSGRDQLEKDTGVKILLREEIFQN